MDVGSRGEGGYGVLRERGGMWGLEGGRSREGGVRRDLFHANEIQYNRVDNFSLVSEHKIILID